MSSSALSRRASAFFVGKRSQADVSAAAAPSLEHREIRPDSAQLAGLSPAAQHRLVEIAHAHHLFDVRLLVLDEPTSSLAQEDASRLFALVRRLQERGVTVVYISHYLEEVRQIADRFTGRYATGRSVGGGSVSDFSTERIIEMMVGRSLAEQFPHIPHTIGEPVLELTEVFAGPASPGVNLTLHRGEILGVAGIVGAGRTELVRAIFGLDPVRQGRIAVRSVAGSASPRQRIEQGVGMLSEDRKGEGLALDQTIGDNLTYSRLRPYSRFGWLDLGRRRRAVAEWLTRLRVRCSGPEQTVGELSGGNQPKVALGRLLHQEADVLLLDEPTRGVSVRQQGRDLSPDRRVGAAQGRAVAVCRQLPPGIARRRLRLRRSDGSWPA